MPTAAGFDIFNLIATDSPASGESGSAMDFDQTRVRILAGLDIAAEYAALGVEFTAPGPNAKGWRECRAVGRDDAHPSAAVHVETGVYKDSGGTGKPLGFFDFAILHSSLGRFVDVWRHYADKAGVEIGQPRAGKGGKVREALYLYLDARGKVRYGVFRYKLPNGKKSFTQHPPDGHGGWQYGAGVMEQIAPLPYRLPEIIASAEASEVVLIVEGERDADRLAGMGYVATTSHGGASNAGSTWKLFDKPPFVGRDVVLIPDNDPPGRAHMDAVGEWLAPIARSVRLLPLPNLPPKGDVSDWLDLGGDPDELGRLIHAAGPWSPNLTPDGKAVGDLTRTATLADIRAFIRTDGWLWQGWIRAGR